MPVTDTLGSRLGPRLATIISSAIVSTSARLASLRHRVGMSIFHSMSDEVSDEVDITLGPVLQALHDVMDADHPVYPAIDFLLNGRGQLKAIAGSGLQMSGILGSVSTVVNNMLAPEVYATVANYPALLPDTSVIGSAYARGQVGLQEALHDLASLGIQSEWSLRLLEQSVTWPDMTELLAFARRGYIDQRAFTENAAMLGISSDNAAMYWQLRDIPLSPADLALATLRGNMTQASAQSKAMQSGVAPDDFGILLENTGEPPGLMQLLEGYRRGFIDRQVLEKGIRQSRYRDEWIPLIEQLRYSPMSVADAVNAVVQNYLTQSQGDAIAQQNGLEPGAFATLYATAGEPLSRTEMEQLYNRGLATEDQVKQALRESRLKDKYNSLAFSLHEKIVPIYALQRVLKYGGVTHSDAIKIAMEQGYSQSGATMLVDSGASERLNTYKTRVVASIQALYEDNIVSLSDATQTIAAMGYDTSEVSFIMRASEFHRESRAIHAAVSAIRSKFLERHIAQNEAIALLNAIPIAAEQRDYLIGLWTIERGAYVRSLTEAQVVKAVKLELITPQDGVSRLVGMGYNQIDSQLLIEGA